MNSVLIDFISVGSMQCQMLKFAVTHILEAAWDLEEHELGFSSALFWALLLSLRPAGSSLQILPIQNVKYLFYD